MKKTLKRSLLVMLALLTMVIGVFADAKRTEAAVTYNNAVYATILCSIDSNGTLSTIMTAVGTNGLTKRIGVELYVEKRILGLFWKRVDIGCTNNIWADSTTSITYCNTFTHNLTSQGKYRVTVTYTFYGNGVADDVIVKTDIKTY